MSNNRMDWALLFLVLIAILVARSLFTFGPVLGGDAAYQAHAAVTVLNGGILYRDVPYTYPPLYAYTEAIVIAVLGNTDLAWKTIPQLYDLGITVLVFLIVKRISDRNKALIAAALYGFSPLPFFATSSFASFDSAAAFWMLASLLLLMTKKPVPSAIALGIGTAYKYFPILLLPASLFYLPTKRQKIIYAAVSIGLFSLVQLPFILNDFNAWLNNVILYDVNRPASGATVYNLISLHPQIWNAQTPLTILSPITLILTFILVAFSEVKSPTDLLKNSALILVAAVFFSKVVLFYSLWYIPLVCIIILILKKHTSTVVLALLITLQLAILLSWYTYTYSVLTNIQSYLGFDYLYLATSGILLTWLLYDRTNSALKRYKTHANQTQAY